MAYFSNGTEGEAWTAVWCDTCVHDHAMHHDSTTAGPGCPLLLAALTGETVPEWTQRDGAPFVLPPDVVCAQYEPCTADRCLGDPQPNAREGARARVTGHLARAAGHGELCATTYGQPCDGLGCTPEAEALG
jgi:hypothetical protein